MKIIILIVVSGTVFNLWHILIAPTEKQMSENNIPSIYERLKNRLTW